MTTCRIDGCDREATATGDLCTAHLRRSRSRKKTRLPMSWPIGTGNRHVDGPLVCECEAPLLGTFNACQICYRKPAALLGVIAPVHDLDRD